jgi:TadE-like protein
VTRGRGGRPEGQSLVEFALVLPIFLVILIGVVDVGRAVWANNAVANAAREAARYAIVHGGTPRNKCPVGPPVTTGPFKTVIPAASSSCPYPSPSTQSITDVAQGYAIAAGSSFTVEVCYTTAGGTACSGNSSGSATNAKGNLVTVRVSSLVPMIVPQLVGVTQIRVDSTSTMVISH